ncbi:MAG: RnfABCDGE type electron transport complex subunit C [Bacilli bacterium]|jgi:electron transport complex protein RnfC
MKLFSNHGKVRLNGHKHLTSEEPVKILDVNKVTHVYFPLLANNAKPITPLVKEGDKVKIGTRIALREHMYVPVFSSVSGKVVANKVMFNPGLGRPCPHLVIENDFKEEVENDALKVVGEDATREEIVNAIKEAGIVGLGGAGFPTWIKYNGVENIEYILINAVECEPFLTTDYVTTIENAKELIEGALLLKKAADAKKVVIAIKKDKEKAINALKEELVNYEDVELHLVPDRYPMGWERTLIEQVFKRTYNNLPSECHVVVDNSQTAIAVYHALKEGKPITKRLLTISGEQDLITNPSNILVPVGTLVSTVLEEFDIAEDKPLMVLNGGPMTSNALRILDVAVQTPNGGFTIVKPFKKRVDNCLRCGECTYHCPAGLQPVEIKLAYEARDFERLDKLRVDKCVECGICSYICPSGIELTDTMKRAKSLLWLKKSQAQRKGK